MSQGLKAIPGFKYNAGIAYVAIPQDLDRDKYIKDCYANHYISMWTEDGGFHNRIPISPEVLNFIEFPLSITEFGSPVVYITDQQYQYHYIVSRFQKREALGDGSENKFKFNRQLNGAHVEINGSATDRSINVLIDGDDKKGVFTINLFNENKDCQLKLDVQGDIVVNSTNNVTLEQYGTFKVRTRNEDDSESSFTQSSSENNFHNTKFKINDGDEPFALGNKLKTFLSNFIDKVAEIQTVTTFGLQPIVNKIDVLKLKQDLDTILSKEAFLKK